MGVSLLGIAVEQVLLAERNGRVFRICKDRPQDRTLLDAVLGGLFEQLDAQDRVVVEVPPRALPVGTDAADSRCGMDHEVSTRIDERTPDDRPFT